MEIAVTIGDVNGISLEAFIKAISSNLDSDEVRYNKFTIFGSQKIIKQYISQVNLPAKICTDHLVISNKAVKIFDIPSDCELEFGKMSAEAGEHALVAIKEATKRTLAGEFAALVTLPVNKEAIHKTLPNFVGHTDYIAGICEDKNPIMILFHNTLRVALATTHIPLHLVGRRVTKNRLCRLISNLNKTLRKDFAIENPQIAVLGMNPHSGENGVLGKEEVRTILPALEVMKRKGVDVFGAFAADGFFAHGEFMKFDGVIAMYHDQGLIPLKLLANGGGVNFTANLKIIRTSPDHGTAFEIAGKNIADPQSTFAAISAAISIAENRGE